MTVLVIGGEGYIGSRLVPRLRQPFKVLDAGYYGKAKGPHIEDLTGPDVAGKVVVNLASFHREKDGRSKDPDWFSAYVHQMATVPARLARAAAAWIQVSSMRALTEDSIYALAKRDGDRALAGRPNVVTVRLGTVWGGLHPELPNRTSTALNFALTRERFEGDHWRAYTTHIDLAISELGYQVLRARTLAAGAVMGDQINVTDTNTPLRANDLRLLLKGRHPDLPLQRRFIEERYRIEGARFDLTQDLKAQRRAWKAAGLR